MRLGRTQAGGLKMGWAIYDLATFDLLRVDLSASAPATTDGSVWIETLTSWPAGARDGFVPKYVNGAVSLVDVRDFAKKRADKWEQIKQIRTGLIDAPLATIHGTFDGDLKSRNSLIGTALRAQMMAGKLQAVAINFTLADNTVVTLDLAKIISVVLLMGSREQSARDVATGLRTSIFAATTTSTGLDAITWPA